NDAVLAAFGGGMDDLIGRRALVHLGEDLVGPGLGTAKDHRQARGLERAPGLVREAGERVDARLAPPAQAKRPERSGDFASMRLVEKEVVVVEMHRIHAVLAG